MHEWSDIKVKKLEKSIIRPGFPSRVHCITFAWGDDGPVDSSFQVWVPAACPDDKVEQVARTFLQRTLLDFSALAKSSIVAESATGRLRTPHNSDKTAARSAAHVSLHSAKPHVTWNGATSG